MEGCLGSGFNLCWRTHVLGAVLMLCSVPAALTQSDVLNIDCGATSSYVDSATGLSWVPDAPYISSGKTQTVTLPTSLQTFTEMQTLRYFDDARAKNCYALPVTSYGIYLLKLSFFYGDYDNANLPPSFQVAIDANIISNITLDATGVSHQEYHYMSQGNDTYVCLIRTSPAATPFISGISLKEASVLASTYSEEFTTLFLQQGIIMTTRNRLNFGGAALIRANLFSAILTEFETPSCLDGTWNTANLTKLTVELQAKPYSAFYGLCRAPADYYDRLWFPSTAYYLTPNVTGNYQFLSTTTPIQNLVGAKFSPPSAVMQSAVTSLGIGTLESFLLPEGSPALDSTAVWLSFYYAELNSSASGPPLRIFSIHPNLANVGTADVNMSGYNFLGYGWWDFWQDGVSLGNSTTVLLAPLPSAQAGPILNCMEIFARSGPRIAKTADQDALAIEDIKKSLNLTEWSGDPCLPFPHAWIICSTPDPTSAPEPVITAVNLSGYQLVGILQASFANLQDLTSLDLSNNSLSGPLPEWLTTMTALRLLAVQNNNFSGPIPEGLLSANSHIWFTYNGNPFLEEQSAPGKCNNCGKSNMAIIAGASAGGVVGLALITVIAILVYCRWKLKRKLSDKEHRANMRIATPGGAKAYTFEEVTAATTQFRRELGKGGFGPVYYGKLPDGQEVAVKVADGTSKHGERAFFTEVDVLSRVHHKNLVALVGYCQEQKQILIYEYMHNGSLFDHLHGSLESTGTLNWKMRLRIALDAAQGLDYLHTACRPSFVHRDVKSSNILLTPQFEAKVTDFGLTRLMGEAEESGVMTNIMGTAGYLDPEYYSSRYISSKSDVYSFGIILLELLTGSLPIDQSGRKERNPNLANWVRECLQSHNIALILDPAVTSSNPNMEAVWTVAEVAMRSVEPKGVHRPTMTEVVQELQGAFAIEAANMRSAQAPTVRSPPQPSESSSGWYGPTSFPAPR